MKEKNENRVMNGKGRKPAIKSQNKDRKVFKRQERKFETDKEVPATNDPAYYFKYPKMAEAIAKLAFAHRNGSHIHTNITTHDIDVNVDAILIYSWMLTPGLSSDINSGINTTSTAAWKMLNRRFRGVNKYQQADFGIIQFGIVDLFASIAEAERVYGLLMHYSLNQRNVPYSLLVSMGIDPNSFDDLADFRAKLNQLILRAKSLCLVKGYSLLDHALTLSANVWKDKDTKRGQLFAFVRDGFWLYDPTSATTGTSLRFCPFTRSTVVGSSGPYLRKSGDILNDLSLQMNALLTDDDVDNVCSDILAFYGNKEDPAELVTLHLLPEDYVVVPMYSEDILRQVHNATFIDGFRYAAMTASTPVDVYYPVRSKSIPAALGISNADLRIYQLDNVIYFEPTMVGNSVGADANGNYHCGTNTSSTVDDELVIQPIIDTDYEDPTPEQIMEMTRFVATNKKNSFTSGGTTYYNAEFTAVPSTWIINARFYYFRDPGLVGSYSTGSFTPPVDIQLNFPTGTFTTWTFKVNNSASTGIGWLAGYLSHFDWHPICYGGPATQAYVLGDIDNYRPINVDLLKPIHDIAILSEFKNPIVDYLLKED